MDIPRGMEYIEKAANQGLAEAQYFVALPVSPFQNSGNLQSYV